MEENEAQNFDIDYDVILSSLAGNCDTLGELMMRIANKEDDIDFIKDKNISNRNKILDEFKELFGDFNSNSIETASNFGTNCYLQSNVIRVYYTLLDRMNKI